MKLKFVFIILLSLFFILAFSSKLSAVSDTAWTLTLPTSNIIGTSYFSEDDSLIIVKVYDPDSSYLCFFNSYNGEIKRKMYYKHKLGAADQLAISYKDTLLGAYSTALFDSNGNDQDKFNIKLVNYKTGEIVGLILSGDDPDLNPDTSYVSHLEFTPDGTKLYAIVYVVNSYDILGNPIYKDKLFVWNVADGSLFRKFSPYFKFSSSFQIAPNNKYYLYNTVASGNCINFRDKSNDTLIHEICPGDSLQGGTFIFPKDTTHLLISYSDKFKLYNLNDFSVEKVIKNDSLLVYRSAEFAYGSRYLVIKADYYFENNSRNVIFDLENNRLCYVYQPYEFSGEFGYDKLLVSNNSQLIFDSYGRSMIMYNAKYETTSVKEPDDEESQMIYPNPANGEISIPSRTEKENIIKIYNLQGYEVDSLTVRDPTLNIKYNTSLLKSGTYFIRFTNGLTLRSFKFIINK